MAALPQTRGSGVDLDSARAVCSVGRRIRVGHRLCLGSPRCGLYGIHSWLDWVKRRVERVSRSPGNVIRNVVQVIKLNGASPRNRNGRRIGLSTLDVDLHWAGSNFDSKGALSLIVVEVGDGVVNCHVGFLRLLG